MVDYEAAVADDKVAVLRDAVCRIGRRLGQLAMYFDAPAPSVEIMDRAGPRPAATRGGGRDEPGHDKTTRRRGKKSPVALTRGSASPTPSPTRRKGQSRAIFPARRTGKSSCARPTLRNSTCCCRARLSGRDFTRARGRNGTAAANEPRGNGQGMPVNRKELGPRSVFSLSVFYIVHSAALMAIRALRSSSWSAAPSFTGPTSMTTFWILPVNLLSPSL